MADFYPVLARAVAGLSDNTPEARRDIYERAKNALLAQLRGLDPPLGEAEIMRERLSLEEAIARVEADHGPPPPPRPAEPAAPPPSEESTPPSFERAASSEPGFAAEPTAQPGRPRVQPPRQRGVKPVHMRTAVVGSGVALAVVAIAATAYYVNKVNPPETPVRTQAESPARPPQTDAAGKLSDRVGDAPATPRGAPAAGAASDVAVAQRAIFYVETSDPTQPPRAITGRAFWRLDSESGGQGRPVETIARATIEIPEAGTSLDFTVRRNADAAFPASHIIGLRFTQTPQAPEQVRDVGVPQFKTEEAERGAPLSAINSALGENLFVSALSNAPVEIDRNTDLILNRSWIDIPLRFASGKRGILTFEKGIPGAQTLSDAFNRWR